MTTRELLGILGALMMVGTTGCVLPDIHDEGVPLTSGSSGPQAACSGSTTVSLRFSNFAPAPGAVDFCVGPKDNLAGPIALLAGVPTGVGYKFDMAYGYNVDGPINVRVIAAGDSCSGQSLGDIVDACFTSPTGLNSASLFYVGGPTAETKLAILPNETSASNALKIRFFNAVHNVASIDFGLTGASTLPTSLKPAVASMVELGHFPPPGNTVLNVPVSDVGFMAIDTMPTTLTWQGWGAAASGSASAVAVAPFTQLSTNLGKMITIVVAGDAKSQTYPVQFIGFDETEAPTGGGTTKPPTKSPTNTGLN
jgi:hypothetical protein